MDPFDGPTEAIARGLSRRQLLCQFGGGCAGWTLASLGLEMRSSPAEAAGSISLRDLLRRISAQGCDASHGIRALLPHDLPLPVTSIRFVAARYAGSVVDFCKPLQFSVRQEAMAGGGVTVYLSGSNFTGGGMAAIHYESDIARDNLDFSVQVQPDGTFANVRSLGCSAPGLALYSLQATDAATGRRANTISGSYTCAQPPPPPPPPTPPSISVSRQGATFTVSGTGFLPSHLIVIRIVDPATFASNYYNSTSDAAWKLSFPVSPHARHPVSLPSRPVTAGKSLIARITPGCCGVTR